MNTTTQIQITQAEERLLQAMKAGDVALLDDLLHNDLLFVIPTGQTVTKEIDLANMKLGNLKIESITTSEQEIRVIEDNAVVSVVVELKGSYLDQPIDGKFKYIRIWKSFGDQWKVIGGAGLAA